MEEKLGQSTAVLFKYEKLILAEEETTSAGGCGVSLAAFSCPASACPSNSASRGVFLSSERSKTYELEIYLSQLRDTLVL